MKSTHFDDLEPIGLPDVMRDAALGDRVDVKYIVDHSVLGPLVDRLAGTHRVLEIGGVREFAYETTYYDSPDLTTLRDHRSGRRRRYKLRRRIYLDTQHHIFEVKLKGRRGRTIKHALPYEGAGDLDGPTLAFARRVVRDAYGRDLPEALSPVLTARCRRVTLADVDNSERVTFDLALDLGGARLMPGLAIVESKSVTGRSVADDALRALGQRPAVRCSKYCLGMTLARQDGRVNDVLPLARSYFAPARGHASAA